MEAFCSICTDLFNFYLPMVAATCGHVYHSACLKKWLNTSHNCPECRAPVTLKTITKLFFNSRNNLVLENRVDELKAKLTENGILLEQLKRENEGIRVKLKFSEERAEQLQQRSNEFESEINQLRCRISEVEAESCKRMQKNIRLKQQVEHLGHVQVIISGSEKDVEDMLKEICCVGDYSLKHLATYCILLKKEIIKLKGKVTEHMSSLHHELVCNDLSTFELNSANTIIKSLREQNSALLRNVHPFKQKDIVNVQNNGSIYGSSKAVDIDKATSCCSKSVDVLQIIPLLVPSSRKKQNSTLEEKLIGQTPTKQKENVNVQNNGIIYGSSSRIDKTLPGCSKGVVDDNLQITSILMPSSRKKRKLDIEALDKENECYSKS